MPPRPDQSSDKIADTLDAILTVLGRLLFRWRLELALAAILAAIYLYLGPVPVAAVLLVSSLLPPLRRLLLRALRAQHVKRRWAHVADVRVTRVREVAAGDLLRIKLTADHTVRDLAARSDKLAAGLSTRLSPVREVRINADREHADRATALLVRRDPFDAPPLPWPLRDQPALSLWDPIPVGVDENGEQVRVNIIGKNLLVGGEPESGKSVAQAIWAAAAALDPDTHLWIMDGKQLDTAIWAPAARRIVGPNGKDAIYMLLELHEEMENRRRELLARGAEKIDRSMGLPLHFVLVDELASYLRLPDSKDVNEILRLLLDLISRGRAVGIIVCAATQRPGHDLHPQFTALRDLISYRFAFRCKTWEMSDMILGTGSSKAGYNAAAILVRQRGVGILHADGYTPVRVRGYYLNRRDLAAIAARAAVIAVPDDASALLEARAAEPRLKAEDQRALANRRALLDALPERGDGLTRSEVQAAVGRPDRELHPVLRELMQAELVYRKGEGKKGAPYRYLRVPAQRAADDPRGSGGNLPEPGDSQA